MSLANANTNTNDNDSDAQLHQLTDGLRRRMEAMQMRAQQVLRVRCQLESDLASLQSECRQLEKIDSGALSFTPQTLSHTSQTLSFTPQTLSHTSQTLSFTPQTLSHTSQTLSFTPQTLSHTSQSLSHSPQTLSLTSQTLSHPSGALSAAEALSAHLAALSKSNSGPKELASGAEQTNLPTSATDGVSLQSARVLDLVRRQQQLEAELQRKKLAQQMLEIERRRLELEIAQEQDADEEEEEEEEEDYDDDEQDQQQDEHDYQDYEDDDIEDDDEEDDEYTEEEEIAFIARRDALLLQLEAMNRKFALLMKDAESLKDQDPLAAFALMSTKPVAN
eukprot:TRINITY_DN2744_c0_g1_i2.p1 TRINITY_DN2744_c0_g1~~TRINITY_DN2744_c0_g1_i2.p1  ORF type:complete len:334 (+),score=111.78 TRINITY_DN2744_c0_g1_i2:68-1069(+)